MPGLSVGLTSTPGSLTKPTLGSAPPKFAAGPGGTTFQYNQGGMFGGAGGGAFPGAVKEGWYPTEKPWTQDDQIDRELRLAQVRRANLDNDYLSGNGPGGTTGVPRTTGSTSTSTSSATGTPPSITQLRTAIDKLQDPDEPGVRSPDMPTAPIAAPKPADNAAATAAAYARAKDKIALEGNAASKAMEGALTARGVSGTGLEAKGRKDITRASMSQLGEVARQQAMSDVQREDEFAKLGYTGGITQRGQDIQSILSKYMADLTQRGQNINQQTNPLGYINPLTSLAMMGGSLY
jgi:hypothetical protein